MASSDPLKISQVRSCNNLQTTGIKEEEVEAPQVIRLKPINQLTKTPVPSNAQIKAQTVVKKVVGSTTIRVVKQNDSSVPKSQPTPSQELTRQIVLKKITKESIKSPTATGKVTRKIVKGPPRILQTIQKQPNEEVKLPVDQSTPQKTYTVRPANNGPVATTPKSSPKKIPPNPPPQKSPPKKAPFIANPPPKQRIIQKVIRIEGLSDEAVAKLPPPVITCIKKLQAENNLLKRMLLNFRNETVGIANNLLKVTTEIDNSITAKSTASPTDNTLKRKSVSPPPVQETPEPKKVKRTIRMPKFPIHLVESLSSFEKDLNTPEFYEFVFQRLQAHLKSRNDITQDNLFDAVLSSMINVDILGEISYDQKTNSLASYQLCFKSLEKFRDLYSRLLNAFSKPKFGKVIEMKEIEDFLQRKILLRGKILQYQKNNDTGNIRITKVKVKPTPKKDNDCEETDNFQWIDDSTNDSQL